MQSREGWMTRVLLLLMTIVSAGPAVAQQDMPQGTLEAEFRRNAQWLIDRAFDTPNQYYVYVDTANLAITLITNRVQRTANGADV